VCPRVYLRDRAQRGRAGYMGGRRRLMGPRKAGRLAISKEMHDGNICEKTLSPRPL
jgi:hypothetical protein